MFNRVSYEKMLELYCLTRNMN